MTETAPKVIVIPAKKETPQEQARKRNLRVAAYCRVSTNSKEQLTSYENQLAYYTEKIMKNPDWTMVKVFADEGKTGPKPFPGSQGIRWTPSIIPENCGNWVSRSSLRNRISTPSIRRVSFSSPYTAPSPSLRARVPVAGSAGVSVSL